MFYYEDTAFFTEPNLPPPFKCITQDETLQQRESHLSYIQKHLTSLFSVSYSVDLSVRILSYEIYSVLFQTHTVKSKS
jgi:hypothetical protein